MEEQEWEIEKYVGRRPGLFKVTGQVSTEKTTITSMWITSTQGAIRTVNLLKASQRRYCGTVAFYDSQTEV
jgi:hypothetical protein